MKKAAITSTGKNHTVVDVGRLDEIGEFSMVHPRTGKEFQKVFLKELIGSTGTEISVQSLAPHTDLPYFHTHKKNEEMYVVLRGNGIFQVDGQCFDVCEGSFVRIGPAGMRGIANNSDGELVFMVIQSREGSLEEYSSQDGTPYPPQWVGR